MPSAALATARRWVGRIATATLATQVAVMVGLTAHDMVARKKRKLHVFPVTPPAPVGVGDDLVSVYTFGRDLYADMLASIRGAKQRIYFETYIWKGDEVGTEFKEALEAAAERGVEVYVVHDGDTYADRWRDTHARIQGPSAAEIENAFVDYWNMRPMGLLPGRPLPELEDPSPRPWGNQVDVYRNMPRWRVYPIRNMYLEAIDRASRHVWLTHAYLIPDDDLTGSLFAAARRGVDVRIIVPAQSNHVVADWLSRGFYDELLSKGVRLFLYQGAMVHSKTATIDGQWSTIGTANLDRLSMAGNYEINVAFHGPEVAAVMERVFAADLGNCLELTLDEWRGRSALAKATEALLAPFRPFF